MVSHRFVLLSLSLLFLASAAPPPETEKGRKEILEEIKNSMPKGSDGKPLQGKELFKELNKATYEKNEKDLGEVDQIADYIAKLKTVEDQFKEKQKAIYAENKEQIDLAKAEAAKLNPKPLPDGARPNFEEINSALGLDDVLIEGDILMSLDELKAHYGNASAHPEPNDRHTGTQTTLIQSGPVAYIDSAARTAVQKAISYYQQYTCIKFYQVSDPSSSPAYPVMRFFPGSGCYSPVGRKYWAQDQAVSIGYGCETFGIAAHEIAHSLGVFHEQSRHDRNSYVYVDEAAIETGKAHNYAMYTTAENNNYGIIYDYRGNMHYRPNAFGINGATVLYALNSLYQLSMGGSRQPMFTDILELNNHYSCMSKCSGSGTVCYYGGYPNPNNCAMCICPSGFGGNDCSYPEPPAGGITCGTYLAASATWQTLNVTRVVGNGQWATTDLDNPAKCTWFTYGPGGSKIQWRVVSLGFEGDSSALCYDLCYWGGINVKGSEASWKNEGIRYCCPSQYNTFTTSKSNLIAVTGWNNYYYTDFVLQYKTA